MKQLLTVGIIAERCGVRSHVVKHWLLTRGVVPAAQAGHAYVYDESVVARFQSEHSGRGPL